MKKPVELFYRIRNKDGMYSSGSVRPGWSKRGKTWNSFRAVKAHISMVLLNVRRNEGARDAGYRYHDWVIKKWKDFYKDAVIVECELRESKELPIESK